MHARIPCSTSKRLSPHADDAACGPCHTLGHTCNLLHTACMCHDHITHIPPAAGRQVLASPAACLGQAVVVQGRKAALGAWACARKGQPAPGLERCGRLQETAGRCRTVPLCARRSCHHGGGAWMLGRDRAASSTQPTGEHRRGRLFVCQVGSTLRSFCSLYLCRNRPQPA